jgi:hypothetical protein
MSGQGSDWRVEKKKNEKDVVVGQTSHVVCVHPFRWRKAARSNIFTLTSKFLRITTDADDI